MPADGGDEEIWFPPAELTTLDATLLEDFKTAVVVKEEEGEEKKKVVVSNAKKLPYPDASFDSIIIVNAAELLTSPRDSFRDVWRCLKPGGKALVAFSAARCSPAAHQAAMTKTWRDYNDAQRIWVVGSYFHFSAGAPAQAMVDSDDTESFKDVWGAGWRSLRGYDYFSSAAEEDKSKVPLYVVQADRAVENSLSAGPAAAADAAMWSASHMEEDDKRLCATRILAMVAEEEEEDKVAMARFAAQNLDNLYETLQPMSSVIATPLLSQLAGNLAPRWSSTSKTQTAALRESLGMDTPRDLFWKPLGDLTPRLSTDGKLWLLADLLPFFVNEENPPVAAALLTDGEQEGAFSAALRIVADKTSSRALDDTEVQLLACDLVARDYLPDAAYVKTVGEAREKAAAFAVWLDTLPVEDLVTALNDRLNFREIAEKDAEDALLDPEQAATKAETSRKAAAVEAMLNDIAKRRNDAKELAQVE